MDIDSNPTLRQISPSLYGFADTCNVYVVRDGPHALLVDAGSGRIAQHLSAHGVDSVEWVLHTHHHRDQCWGTPALVERYDCRVAVPEYERYLFEHATEYWKTRRVYDNYNDRSTAFGLGEDMPVGDVLLDYEEFTWRDFRFFVLPAKGNTFGSSALLAEIDGRTVAFTGDLICEGGHVHDLHALEYGYGDLSGILFTLQSLQALERRSPDFLLPSHGPIIETPLSDMSRLKDRLMDIAHLGEGLSVDGGHAIGVPATRFLPDPQLVQISEHLLWSGPWACAMFYVLLSGEGQALFVDYGQAFIANLHLGVDSEPHETMRFVEHHLDELRDSYGVARVEVVIPTHIHDDHTCGIPYLQRHHGTECWALDQVAQVLRDPAAWASTSCVFPKPIRIDREVGDGTTLEWRGYELRFDHAPGQTEFHSVVSTTIDGRRVAFTGDNLFMADVEVAGSVQRRAYQTTVMRNSFQLEMHRKCADLMTELQPELICPGHAEIIPCHPGLLKDYSDFIARKERAFRAIVRDPADQHIDLFWARLLPYLANAGPEEDVRYTLKLRNNLERSAVFGARLMLPPGWKTPATIETIQLDAGEAAEITVIAHSPDAEHDRHLVTAEILIDDVSLGPVCEALVSVSSGREGTRA
jgi:glyoxylase-like metal-dependent hydrolase (beta-lactamase superfamily II)